METSPQHAPSRLTPSLLGWGIGALLFSLLVVTRNTAGQIQEAGTGTLILAVIVGTALGCLGALLGQFLRNLAHPDAVYTTGGFFSLVGLRLFWLCGPQLIGLAGGVFLGIALIVH
ncbi:hypothetical protein I5N03_01470 [Serratia marcescens]|uniref:hypothetical protein n=1 Tax=Serratia TaxID=613 RepID=UPI0005C62D31|nr:hypothetical protein [Serratia sp. FS14]MBH3159197.1 hypothetical protein [Serratia marcescens]MBH3180648.1 hypothetical protein [Serratia marcescens]